MRSAPEIPGRLQAFRSRSRTTGRSTGMPLTMGSDLFGGFSPSYDAFVVRRLREAGFVIVGKTSMPEMGILPTTEPRRFGPTRNPWDTDRTPGGSSGGAAAAVAAGMVPVAHGNDGGGSIRIPASCCGLVGLKPARGRVSCAPDSGESFLVCDGVLTRTVADTANVLDVLAGPELGDATWAPPAPAAGYAALAAVDPGGCGSGWRSTRRSRARPSIRFAPRPPATRRRCSIRSATRSRRSRRRGRTSISCPTSPGRSARRCRWEVVGGQIAGREPTAEDVEPLTWALWERARSQDTIAYLIAQSRLESVARSMVGVLAPYDAVMTPALAGRPCRSAKFTGAEPTRWATTAARRLHAVHRDHQHHRAARDRTAAVPRRRRPPDAVQLIGRRHAKRCCSGSRRSSSARCRGPVGCRRGYRRCRSTPSIARHAPMPSARCLTGSDEVVGLPAVGRVVQVLVGRGDRAHVPQRDSVRRVGEAQVRPRADGLAAGDA